MCVSFSGGLVMCEFARHPKMVAVIRRAREIIVDPARWTPAWESVDAEGNNVHGRHAKAVRFSGVGAVDRAAMEVIPDYYGSAKLAARDACWAVNTLYGRGVR